MPKKRSLYHYLARYLLAIVSSFGILACSSDSDDGVVSSPIRITGTVVNQANGTPIRDALITTLPPTEQVTTGADGRYLIEDFNNQSQNYEVSVKHTGYQSEDAIVAAAPGTTATVNFSMQSTATGLIASKSLLQFPAASSTETFLLTSTVEQTTFSIQSTDPRLSAFPTEGTISNSETFVITVSIDNTILASDSPRSGQLVINTDNGSTGAIINFQIVSATDNSQSLLADNQLDCRRPDIVRILFDDPSFSLVQFPESLTLPASAGQRFIGLSTNTPLLFDSLIVTELGEVTITHVAGATENSSVEIFDMNLDGQVRELAFNTGQSITNQRASLTYAVIPGIYCYYLGPTVGLFSLPAQLQVDISFRTAATINNPTQ